MNTVKSQSKSCEEIIKDFTSMYSIDEHKKTLQDLFEEWVIHSAGETEDSNRCNVVWFYRQLVELLNDIENLDHQTDRLL